MVFSGGLASGVGLRSAARRRQAYKDVFTASPGNATRTDLCATRSTGYTHADVRFSRTLRAVSPDVFCLAIGTFAILQLALPVPAGEDLGVHVIQMFPATHRSLCDEVTDR